MKKQFRWAGQAFSEIYYFTSAKVATLSLRDIFTSNIKHAIERIASKAHIKAIKSIQFHFNIFLIALDKLFDRYSGITLWFSLITYWIRMEENYGYSW